MKNHIKALILDMDGVLWRGPQPIGDLAAVFGEIARKGLKVLMATNNATRTPESYVARFEEYGVRIEPWQVINSAEVAARYLKTLHPNGGPVFVVGEEGLQQALKAQGFWPAEQDVLAVVAGMDRHLSYTRLSRATLLLRGGAAFIGTNGDRSFPTPEGLVPGAGSILALLETASDRVPVVLGKPHTAIYEAALERLGTAAGETMVVGDRIETDIAGAQQMGCPVALVLSGVTTPEQAQAWRPEPDLIAADLADVVGRLP
ncbi:MAG: HAD-IIA family hydrolase [Chloroflexota bacterium]